MEEYQSPYLAHIQDIYEAIGRLLEEAQKQETALAQQGILEGFRGNFTQDILRFKTVSKNYSQEDTLTFAKGYAKGVAIGSVIEEAFSNILVESGVFNEMTKLYFHEK